MRGFFGRRRLAARLALRDAAAHRGRTTFVAIMVALPILAVTAPLVAVTSGRIVGADLARATLGDGAQALVMDWSDGPITQTPTDPWSASEPADGAVAGADKAALRAALPAGDSLTRALGGQLSLSGTGGTLGVDGAAAPQAVVDGLPYRSGRAPAGPGEVALTPYAVQELAVSVGDPVHVVFPSGAAVTGTVVGELSSTWRGAQLVASPDTVDDSVWQGGPLPTRAQWWVVGPTPVTWEDVQRLNAIGYAVLSSAVLTDPPAGVSAAADGGPSLSVEARGLAPLVALVLVTILEIVLLIGPAFAVGVRRTERHLALLAAVGGDRRTLARVVRCGGAVVGLGASVLGALVGIVLAAGYRLVARATEDPFVYPTLRVPVLAVAGVVAVGTAVAVAAAWLPSRRAAQIDVVAALANRRPTPPRRRGLALLAGVAVVAGALAAQRAVTEDSLRLLAAGLTVLVLGLVALSGTLVAVVARLAPRLGPAARFAARDAERQRARTAPAVAAVLAATAGMIVVVVTSQSSAEHDRASYTSDVAVGVVAVDFTDASPSAEAREGLVATSTEAVRAHLPIDQVAPVSVAVVPDADPDAWYRVEAEPAPSNTCPLENAVATDPAWDFTSDARCMASLSSSSYSTHWPDARSSVPGVRVDDGTAMALTGLPGAADAAAALRTGHAVVRSPLELWPDGTVRVVVTRSTDGGRPEVAAISVPAVALPLGGGTPIVLPPEALGRLGLTSEVAGLVASTTRTPTDDELTAVNAALGVQGSAEVEPGPPAVELGQGFLATVALALLVGVGATAVVVALAATDARPDLAVLAAVGASPRTRRRVAAAQAAVVAVLGSAVGTVTGLLLGRLLVTLQARSFYSPVPWEVLTPWPVVAAIALGVPTVAVGAAYLCTPSRLPAVARRIA